MFVVNSYALAVVFCFVTMLCWGSWGNTQKLAAKSWRYELFYWDYVIGMVVFSLILAFTLGSFGSEGRHFVNDLAQASASNLLWIILGGVIFNASNILLSASTSIAGMSVAFPLGCGLALVLGVINNLRVEASQGSLKSNVPLLALGVALVVLAVVFNGIASGKKGGSNTISKEDQRKGVILALVAGIVMSFFSSFVMRAMDLNDFAHPEAGKVTPYTAIVIFAAGVFVSNFIFNTLVMKKPFIGEPVSYRQYFSGNAKTHLVGMLGGSIWCLGTALSYITAGKAGAAISYALGQGAPMIAAIWGVFIWKEFKGAQKSVYGLLGVMFALFVAGLACIVFAGN
ncbi:MAG: GRP family sugar transporter [Bacteroidales bacterium]|nr:multidrug DMT transporter permease [Candidatus Cryptobacteroides onthequi]MCQ2165127.1 GRP family sugar transporter [Bacteroidales bacterium]